MSLEQSNDDGSTPTVRTESGEVLSAKGNARRRFTRQAGAGTAGVLLTLASQPGMATNMAKCQAPSRQMSLMHGGSPRANDGVACSPANPVVWSHPNCSWPVSKTACMRDVLPCGSSTYGTYKLMDIVSQGCNYSTGTMSDLSGNPMADFGRALVTTYLNVASGKIGFLNQESVVSMYVAMTTTMQYRVDATTVWNMADLTAYLKKTYS
ncbi:MAG: hypothetical protein JWP59_2150 [Massilia sp.]|nr:hypothetical protein [Massilia sp.]